MFFIKRFLTFFYSWGQRFLHLWFPLDLCFSITVKVYFLVINRNIKPPGFSLWATK